MEFQQVLDAWLQDRSAANLAALLDAVQSQLNYDAGLELASTVVPLLDAGRYAEARDHVMRAMPGAFLSPSAHALLARAFLGLGDEPAAARESAFSAAATVVILSSGEGTERSPHMVLRVGDEYDVLAAQGLEVEGQRVAQPDGRILDCLTTADGDVWFELRRAGRRIKGAA